MSSIGGTYHRLSDITAIDISVMFSRKSQATRQANTEIVRLNEAQTIFLTKRNEDKVI